MAAALLAAAASRAAPMPEPTIEALGSEIHSFEALGAELDRRLPSHGGDVPSMADMFQTASGHFSSTRLPSRLQEVETFWAWDFGRDVYYEIEAELVHVSPLAWIYVEEGQAVDGIDVARLAVMFEDVIYPRLTHVFGSDPQPGIDGQPAITLLLMDIRDPYYYGSFPFVSGYFLPVNQYLQSDLDRQMSGHRSNEREMLYIDVDPADPKGETIGQTIAHELQHLIHWNHDRDEAGWLNEGLSELGVFLSGLGHPSAHVAAFLENPESPLTTWRGLPGDYGKTYMFLLYLHERVGSAGWLTELVADADNGFESLAALHPGGAHLNEIWRNFALALLLDSSDTSSGYGFESLELGRPGAPAGFASPVTRRHPTLPVSESGDIPPWSVRLDQVPLGRGTGADVALDLGTDPRVCGGAVGPAGQALLGCGSGIAPVKGSVPGSESSGRLVVALANSSDDVRTVGLAIEPDAGSHASNYRALLPIGIAP